MAITPRTILTSPAPATVAVVSLYFFTVLGTTAFTCLTDSTTADNEPVADEISIDALLAESEQCQRVAQRFGSEPDDWSKFAWISVAYCFDQQDESRLAIDAATLGLEEYPHSEVLYNLKGYHQIVLGEHAEAIETLEEGMERVLHHRNGVMANNLAWAGLFEPRKVHPEDARELYMRSLAQSPGVCETLHTGLFVEFAIADRADGIEQFEPRKRFAELRNEYNRCLDRLADGDRKTLAEVVGAAVLFDEMDNNPHTEVQPLMASATSVLVNKHDDVSVDELCEEAMPLAGYHHECVQAVETSLRTHEKRAEQREQRRQRAHEVKMQIKADGAVIHKRVERTVSSGCGGFN